jgi:hypothetical protein
LLAVLKDQLFSVHRSPVRKTSQTSINFHPLTSAYHISFAITAVKTNPGFTPLNETTAINRTDIVCDFYNRMHFGLISGFHGESVFYGDDSYMHPFHDNGFCDDDFFHTQYDSCHALRFFLV